MKNAPPQLHIIVSLDYTIGGSVIPVLSYGNMMSQ
jgi:hypothetical protein